MNELILTFADTETTMLNRAVFDFSAPFTNSKNWPRLLELGFLKTINQLPIKKYNELVEPEGFVIPPRGKGFDNITQAKSMEEGIKLLSVIYQFSEELQNTDYLIWYNSQFDMQVLKAEMHRIGFDMPQFPKVIDAKKLALHLGYQSTKHKYGMSLVDIAAHFGIEYKNAHSAYADSVVLQKVFFKLIEGSDFFDGEVEQFIEDYN